jgi:hypothetical protein
MPPNPKPPSSALPPTSPVTTTRTRPAMARLTPSPDQPDTSRQPAATPSLEPARQTSPPPPTSPSTPPLRARTHARTARRTVFHLPSTPWAAVDPPIRNRRPGYTRFGLQRSERGCPRPRGAASPASGELPSIACTSRCGRVGSIRPGNRNCFRANWMRFVQSSLS